MMYDLLSILRRVFNIKDWLYVLADISSGHIKDKTAVCCIPCYEGISGEWMVLGHYTINNRDAVCFHCGRNLVDANAAMSEILALNSMHGVKIDWPTVHRGGVIYDRPASRHRGVNNACHS